MSNWYVAGVAFNACFVGWRARNGEWGWALLQAGIMVAMWFLGTIGAGQ